MKEIYKILFEEAGYNGIKKYCPSYAVLDVDNHTFTLEGGISTAEPIYFQDRDEAAEKIVCILNFANANNISGVSMVRLS